MTAPIERFLRSIPSVDVLLQNEEIAAAGRDLPRRLAVRAIRAAADEVRALIRSGGCAQADVEAVEREVIRRAVEAMRRDAGPHYRRAINATGIILHTGLGRAVLAPRAIEQIASQLSGYSVLQLGVETGKRDRRDGRIEWLLKELTGCEAATVVNNNAGATLLVLNTVGAGREVIVSRGQLVEIGGAFRLPDVMRAAGVTLVEVGTTNRTHPRDYENAITENTAALLRVHPSNYRIEGFSSEVPLADMERIARARGLTLIDDVGAGALIDFSRFGFKREPTLPESVGAGADLVTSSGDKLIGAGQGGIILGRAELVERVRRNPLARALRVDKLTLAVLEATLTLFLDEPAALREVPILRMLMRPLAEIARQARRIASALRKAKLDAEVEAVDGFSQMGSGSLPGQDLPTRLVAVVPKNMSADALAERLRLRDVPVFTRIHEGRLLLDPRTVLDGEEKELITALVETLASR